MAIKFMKIKMITMMMKINLFLIMIVKFQKRMKIKRIINLYLLIIELRILEMKNLCQPQALEEVVVTVETNLLLNKC